MIAQDKHRSALFLRLKRLRLFVVGVAHHFHHNADKQQYKLMPCGPHSLWGFRIFLLVNLLFHTLRFYSISAHLSTMIFSRRKMKDISISFFVGLWQTAPSYCQWKISFSTRSVNLSARSKSIAPT